MRIKIIVALAGFLLLSLSKIVAQTTVTAEQVAERIAQKMKDSLALDSQQKGQVYRVNMYLHNQKTFVRQQRAGTDSVGYYIQKVEGKRDSLYRTILPERKYQLYLRKKRNLISAN